MLTQSLFSLMPMFVALFWVILLLLDKRHNLPQLYLAFFLFMSFINYLTHASFFLFEYKVFAFLDNLWVFTSLSGYPLYYYYLRLLTRDTRIRWKWCWILIPSLSLSLFSFVIYFLMSDEELYLFIHHFMYHEGQYDVQLPLLVRLQVFRTYLFKWIFAIQLIAVVVMGFRLITHYDKRLAHFYSDMQGRDLTSFKKLLIAFLFASLISILSSAIGKDFFIDKGLLMAVPSVLHSVFLYWVAFAGFNQRFTISDFKRDIEEYRKQRLQGETDNKVEPSNISLLLNDIVIREMLFTRSDLKISDLALRLNTNRSYISRAINDEMHTDFCSWVNHYRINYAQELLDDFQQSNLSMEVVAEKSGFANLTTFYRVFKKHTNMTPGDYLRNQKH